jgi:hypothetical protein
MRMTTDAGLHRAGVVLLAGLALSGCKSHGDSGGVCDDLYATIGAAVIDSTGASVTALSGLVVQDSVLRTGSVTTVAQLGFPAASATVFTDNQIGTVMQHGDSVFVVGTLGARTFRSGYRFGSDGCHVAKLAGPDTVTLR